MAITGLVPNGTGPAVGCAVIRPVGGGIVGRWIRGLSDPLVNFSAVNGPSLLTQSPTPIHAPRSALAATPESHRPHSGPGPLTGPHAGGSPATPAWSTPSEPYPRHSGSCLA